MTPHHIALYESGAMSSLELAEIYNVTQRTIRNRLKAAGARMRPHGGARKYERCK